MHTLSQVPDLNAASIFLYKCFSTEFPRSYLECLEKKEQRGAKEEGDQIVADDK